MTTSRKWIASLAVAAAVTLFSLSSSAAEADGAAISKTVKMWDLDLAKAADVQTLNARLLDTANAVCNAEVRRNYRSTRRGAPKGWLERCVNDAMAAAVRDVGNRRLAMDTTTPRPLF